MVRVDFEEVGRPQAGDGLRVEVGIGQHVVEAETLDGLDRWETVVEVEDATQLVVTVKLAGVRAAREAEVRAREAEATARAEEARRRRREAAAADSRRRATLAAAADSRRRATLAAADSRRREALASISRDFVEVPAGPFLMGSDKSDNDESPQHRVTLPAFYIGRHEVTVAQYAAFVEDSAGARAVNGNSLSLADFNLSSARARTERARHLGKLADAVEIDWDRLLEEFCQRVLMAEREGRPAVLLREFPRPVDDHLDVEGIRLHRRHPAILFGDGGTAKSYTALYLAGRLDQRGVRVLYADWEFAGEDHRDRLERLFGPDMPAVTYVRCERPLVHEADRLRRIVQEDEITYVIYDSIAFATDGPPEAAEMASAYFRAVRQIGVGSLHIAHVNRSDTGDKKPFGSSFWHNGAPSTWKREDSRPSPRLRRTVHRALQPEGEHRLPAGGSRVPHHLRRHPDDVHTGRPAERG